MDTRPSTTEGSRNTYLLVPIARPVVLPCSICSSLQVKGIKNMYDALEAVFGGTSGY